jgi:hypothetical protein
VNGRQMLPKFDVPKCHCASFLKYGMYVSMSIYTAPDLALRQNFLMKRI